MQHIIECYIMASTDNVLLPSLVTLMPGLV